MRSHPRTPLAPPVRPRKRSPDEPVAAGCGWFDSSVDLHRGLNVVELDLPQAALAQVPLHWWLSWALEPQGAPPVGRADAWSGRDRH